MIPRYLEQNGVEERVYERQEETESWGKKNEPVPLSSKTEGNNIQKERMSTGQDKQKQRGRLAHPISLSAF